MHGNEREPTWPKRAEGLVKKGRAYRLAEDHICLIDPSDGQSDHAEENCTAVHPSDIQKISEETYMNTQENVKNEAIETEKIAEEIRSWGKLSMDYVLDKIEAVRKDSEYLYKTVHALEAMQVSQGPEDIAGQAKAQALADVVRCRETTNQQLIQLYTRMYDDLKPTGGSCESTSTRLQALEMVKHLIVNADDMDDLPEILESMQNFCDSLRFI
ncbi:MAG: hypothetical protein E7631_12570 [Ruminococcaceae bacterium]|nr:hypothetical protein [Oscillospiraceae bacterium]